jgi:hypothetical protein
MFIGGSCATTYKKPMRGRTFPGILLGFIALLGASPVGIASAQPYGPPPGPPTGPPPPFYRDPRDGVQPLDHLLPGIRRAHPGDFYDAEGPTYGPEGDPHYHLKWMTPDGRIIWFDTDARNGRVLRASPGRDSFDSHQGAPSFGRDRFDPHQAGPPFGRERFDSRQGGPPPGRERFDPHQGGPPPGYERRFSPGGIAPGYSYGPRFNPHYAGPNGGMGGGGRWRH